MWCKNPKPVLCPYLVSWAQVFNISVCLGGDGKMSSEFRDHLHPQTVPLASASMLAVFVRLWQGDWERQELPQVTSHLQRAPYPCEGATSPAARSGSPTLVWPDSRA